MTAIWIIIGVVCAAALIVALLFVLVALAMHESWGEGEDRE